MFKVENFEEPFDPVTFVEATSKCDPDNFNPLALKQHFESTIRLLEQLGKQEEGRIVKLEKVSSSQESQHKGNVKNVNGQYKEASDKFDDLDDRINYVATKVVHLGDQLENINTPRQRILEAQTVMKYFEEFHSGKELSPIFQDPEQVHEAASIVHQLTMMAQELPDFKFKAVKKRIIDKYISIEDDLLLEFKRAYQKGNMDAMAKCANTLLPFKSYHLCYEELIRMTMSETFQSSAVFEEVLPACKQVQEIASKVFVTNSEMVMAKFVQTIFEKKLQGHIYIGLNDKSDLEYYLKTLSELYAKTRDLTKKLAGFKLGSDSTFLDRLKKVAFQKYLSTYIDDELQYLEEDYKATLERFYASLRHQKREKHHGQGFSGIEIPVQLQELQRRIPGRNQTGLKENLVSQDVAVNLLQENKLAIRRCELLSSPSNLALNVCKIFKCLLKYLGEEHLDYGVEMTLQALPSLEPKTEPPLLFLNVLHQANAIFHLLDKHFTGYILRPVGSSPVYSECAHCKKMLIEQLEPKLDQGTERLLTSIVNYLRSILNSEQKKLDFRPEEAGQAGPVNQTAACKKSCNYINDVVPKLKRSMDGKNLEVVLTEFGVRFQKQLFEHLHQFTFTSMGAMVALCDINEYRHAIKKFEIPLLDRLYATMFSLVDLLVVMPENLKDVCLSKQYAGIDKTVLQQFIQLRADYKTAKLARVFTDSGMI